MHEMCSTSTDLQSHESITSIDIQAFNCKCGPCRCSISLCENDLDDITGDEYFTPDIAKQQMTNQLRKLWPTWNLNFTKPRIDHDENSTINEEYITPETKLYLANRKEDLSNPWRKARQLFPFLWKTKEYDDDDKYKAPDVNDMEEDDEVTIASVLSAQMEEVRLRLFWKPTKDYDENDKYAVTVSDSDIEEEKPDVSSPYENRRMTPVMKEVLRWEEAKDQVERQTSSFESADSTFVPYK